MRICVVASSYPRYPGDIAGTFVEALTLALLNAGHDVRVLAPYHPAVQQEYDRARQVTRFRYGLPGWPQLMGYGDALENDQRLRFPAYALAVPYLLTGAAALLRLVRRWRPHVIHAHWVLPNGPVAMLAGRIARVPFVVTLHGSDVYLARRVPLLSALTRRTLRRAAAVTLCSPEMAAAADAWGVPDTQQHLIPWGADPQRFHSPDCAGVRATYGIGADQDVILAVGRMVEKKGFSHLIEAFATRTAHDRGRSAVLALGGDGPLRPQLEREVRAAGIGHAVRFLGRVPADRMPEVLGMATVLALPSVQDGSGNVDGLPVIALEAMASGKPVVASRIAGLPLVVQHGETGLLTPPGNVPALAAALGALLDDPARAQAMGAAARRRVETELNWDAVAQRYVQVYQQAIGG